MSALDPMTLQATEPEEVQRFVAITALGMCRAILQGAVSPAYACSRLFGPALLTRLEAMEVHPELRHAIHLATELEDVDQLVPEALTRSIAEIEDRLLKLLATLPAPTADGERWLGRLPSRGE
ncbi:DUF3969 family protein [Corallococcus sp. bb12-1]|uniref:DUF3969 family protein n=1 Tax=Corallococcus sp. bb12-1 TaxID=2996784 RepID=UPI00226FDEB0|nr:DUF3969 family protein [Corallococcus sp. bb12-1]MCY1040525.1 DUF3969 family protein [Corallococcus sp. bb12-1]